MRYALSLTAMHCHRESRPRCLGVTQPPAFCAQNSFLCLWRCKALFHGARKENELSECRAERDPLCRACRPRQPRA